MPNGVRHVLGLIAGVVLTPALAAGLFYGTDRLVRVFQMYFVHGGAQWTAVAVLAVVGVVLGVLVGSRMSPLASLVPGLIFTVVGVLWAVAPRWMMQNTHRKLPTALDRGYLYVGPYGMVLVLGLLLLVGSLAPSRWRARGPHVAARHTYEYGTPDPGAGPASGPGPGFEHQGAFRSLPQYGQQPPEGPPPQGLPPGYRDQGPVFPDRGPEFGRDPRRP